MTSNEIKIIITITDGNITVDGQNLPELTKADIVDSIKLLISLAEILHITGEGEPTNGDA